jgi:hypothetical protein
VFGYELLFYCSGVGVIFVGEIPTQWQEECDVMSEKNSFLERFKEFGAVDARIQIDKRSGKRLNYGFVVFGCEELAEAMKCRGRYVCCVSILIYIFSK